jgi:hypothetical protein
MIVAARTGPDDHLCVRMLAQDPPHRCARAIKRWRLMVQQDDVWRITLRAGAGWPYDFKSRGSVDYGREGAPSGRLVFGNENPNWLFQWQ